MGFVLVIQKNKKIKTKKKKKKKIKLFESILFIYLLTALTSRTMRNGLFPHSKRGSKSPTLV